MQTPGLLRNPEWASTFTGFFGGAFDPPHRGHRQAVATFLERVKIEKLRVTPTGASTFKQGRASALDRLEMTKLNFKPSRGDSLFRSPGEQARIEVSDQEIGRALRTGEATYTIDSLRELTREGRKMVVFLGSDLLAHFHEWKAFPELLTVASWIVIARSPSHPSQFEPLHRFVSEGRIKAEQTTEGLPLYRVANSTQTLEVLHCEVCAVSSSEVRAEINRTGQPPQGKLIPEVEEYLSQRHLYGSQA